MPATAPRQRILTGPMIAALVALLALAVATVVVVATSDGDPQAGPTDPGGTGGSSGTAETVDGPGAQTTSDGVMTFDFPGGYADATGKVDATSIASAYDTQGDKDFPTTIVITKESLKGYTLQQMAEEVADGFNAKFSANAYPDTEFPLSEIDGKPLIAYQTESYDNSEGLILVSEIVLTELDGTAYGFIMNTLAGSEGAAGEKLVELIESVQWT